MTAGGSMQKRYSSNDDLTLQEVGTIYDALNELYPNAKGLTITKLIINKNHARLHIQINDPANEALSKSVSSTLWNLLDHHVNKPHASNISICHGTKGMELAE